MNYNACISNEYMDAIITIVTSKVLKAGNLTDNMFRLFETDAPLISSQCPLAFSESWDVVVQTIIYME